MSSVTGELKGVRRPRFYLYALILAAAVLFAGFAKSYFLKVLFGTPALYPLLHLHGIVMTSWFVLFAVQTWLVSAHRTDLHRRLGIFGVLLTSIILIVGAAVVTINAREGRVPDAASVPVVIALSYANLLVFGGLVAAAVYLRGRSEYHKRLMLLATLNLLSAAINRIPLDFIAAGGLLAVFGLLDLFIVICVGIDTLRHRRLHPAFVWGAIVSMAWPWLAIMAGGSSVWAELTQRILSAKPQ